MMVAPIRCTVVVRGKACSFPPGLQVLHAYTMLTAGSKQVLIVGQNMTYSAIFLKRGVHVVHITSAMMVHPEEASGGRTRYTRTKRMSVHTREAGETIGKTQPGWLE